jgi:hypothetical protein
LVEYKIPGLGIGLDALTDIIEGLTGWKRHKVSVQISCTGACEAQTWRARVRFSGTTEQTIEATGADMLRYVDQRSDIMFLNRLAIAPDQIDPVDFFRFVSFEAKQYTDPCTRNILLLGFAPEVILTKEWRTLDMVGPYSLTECGFLIGAINRVNAGQYDRVISDAADARLLDHETNGLQYAMVREFARFKLGDKKSVDLATEMAHWIDRQICKPGVPNTNWEGSLHRYILAKWDTHCPLSEADPAAK